MLAYPSPVPGIVSESFTGIVQQGEQGERWERWHIVEWIFSPVDRQYVKRSGFFWKIVESK